MVMGEGDMRFGLDTTRVLAQGCWGWEVAMVGCAGPSLSRRQRCGAVARSGCWRRAPSHAGVLSRYGSLQSYVPSRTELPPNSQESMDDCSDLSLGLEGLPGTSVQGH